MTEEYPDLLVYWNPELEYGIEYNVEVYKKDESCEACLKKGAYVIRDDPNSLGICRTDLGKDTKTIVKIVELPKNHNY